jgi:PleD family two-component response regulator
VGQVKNGQGGWKELLAKCDQALYAEKDEGRKTEAPVQ